MNFFSPCPRGLEPILAEELKALGVAEPRIVPGGVHFAGEWSLCYRVNLESRIPATHPIAMIQSLPIHTPAPSPTPTARPAAARP